MTADITLRGPGDVLAALPFQLGYHPSDSVVIVSLHARRVGLVARADLPPPEHVRAASAALLGPVLREGATSVIVVGFEQHEDGCLPLLLRVVEELEGAAVEVVDVQVVRDGRRYSPVCSLTCCPTEGVPLPDPSEVPAVAEFVVRGRSPLATRAAVDAQVEAVAGQEGGGLADEVGEVIRSPAGGAERVRGRRRRAARAWAALLAPTAESPSPGPAQFLTAAQVSAIAVGLADVPWRDGVIAWLSPGVLPFSVVDASVLTLLRRVVPPGEGSRPGSVPVRADVRGAAGPGVRGVATIGRDELHHRLLRLCRAVPDDCPAEAAAVCSLAAAVLWHDGDGALARAAVERAMRLTPTYRLAGLLHRVIENGVRVDAAGRTGRPLRRTG